MHGKAGAHLEGAVFAAADDEAGVRSPADLIHGPNMPPEGAHKGALHPIPELYGLVEGRTHQVPAVRGELDLRGENTGNQRLALLPFSRGKLSMCSLQQHPNLLYAPSATTPVTLDSRVCKYET